MSSTYPNSFDDDSTIPAVNDNITEIGGDAINALRDAVFNIESTLGLNVQGTQPSLANRLAIFINPDGSPNTSVLTSLGLVTLPITNNQIANNAGIPESKLTLDYSTNYLYNQINNINTGVNTALGWIAVTGVKLDPHLAGAIYRHDLTQINVSPNINTIFLNNKFRNPRNNSSALNVLTDLNNELLFHQWADGYNLESGNVITNSGASYPANYAHVGSGIFLNNSRYNNIPDSIIDVQAFVEYVDTSNLLLSTTLENLYSNGISRTSTSSNLLADGYGQFIVPVTTATTYLRGSGGNSSTPVDDINFGDDIIQFNPSSTNITSNLFDSQFALVKPGDIITVNYGNAGNVFTKFVISEIKYIQNNGSKKYAVRIAGKNLFYSTTATASITRSLVNTNKYGVLACAPANNAFLGPTSLIIGSARGAQALGINFSPDQFNETHYFLYLALFPTGNPSDGYTILPGIDVTGNAGTTPGQYTLDTIIANTNNTFRQAGYNYRFIAFSNDGEFGIMLADSYNNAGFSVISGVVNSSGGYDQTSTNTNFPNNVVDVFPTVEYSAPDPLGFGPFNGNIASPPYQASFNSTAAALIPTQLFVPLRRNNYYVNGTELERFNTDVDQVLDSNGDGYWVGTILPTEVNVIPGSRVQTTYRVASDLSTSKLAVGKTIVVQSLGFGSLVDFGRFIISGITFSADCVTNPYTDIQVYDAVHGMGFSPATTLGIDDGYSGIGNIVAIYFSPDSVSFNAETATDWTNITPFKRHFEIYIDSNSNSFTHERARLPIGTGSFLVDGLYPLYGTGSGQLSQLDILAVSPKLKGYTFGAITKITLIMSSYSNTTGIFDGYLAYYNGTTASHIGPVTTGRLGEVIRFYDETNIDYIDIKFNINLNIATFNTNNYLDFQLFPTLSLDSQNMLIGTCQYSDGAPPFISNLVDKRQFGNTSEENFTTSALDYISLPTRLLNMNGVIRGFDLVNTTNEFISIDGGVVLVNGNFEFINPQIITVPKVVEYYNSINYNISYALCVNSNNELILIPLTNFNIAVNNPLNAINRIMTVQNVVSLTAYQVDCTNFSNLLNNRQDLTPIYIINSFVSGTGSGATVTLSSQDIRRFINSQDSNFPAILTSDNSQGNFKNLTAALNWLNFNQTFQNELQIKGNFTVTNTLIQEVNINGRGAPSTGSNVSISSLTFSNPITVISTIFDNLNLTFNSGLQVGNGVRISGSTVEINSTVNGSGIINFNNSFIGFNTVSNTISGYTFNNGSTIQINIATIFTNTTFNNCTLQVNVATTFTNCIFNNCTINFLVAGSSLAATGNIWNNNIINFTTTLSSFSLDGSYFGNKFNYSSGVVIPTINITNTFNLSNNKFIALGSSFTGPFISIADTNSGTISGNYFSRGSNTLGSYISGPASYSSGIVSIVNNIFDSSTSNGIGENLVINLPYQWIYSNNTNSPTTLNNINSNVLTGGTYTLGVSDTVLMISLTSNLTINLPIVSSIPNGRILIIKDITGSLGNFTITLHRGINSDSIENLVSDYILYTSYGSLTLVSIQNLNNWMLV